MSRSEPWSTARRLAVGALAVGALAVAWLTVLGQAVTVSASTSRLFPPRCSSWGRGSP